MIMIIALFVIPLALIIVGIAVKNLIWLAIVGLVLFVAAIGLTVVRGIS